MAMAAFTGVSIVCRVCSMQWLNYALYASEYSHHHNYVDFNYYALYYILYK